MPRPLPEASKVRSIALAKSPLTSARKSILSAAVAFFQASMTKTSLTDVSATVLTPFALIASACCVIEGTCILWQVLVKAPGTANSATFLPLKMSSVLFHAGPSDVITRNFAWGSRSPTLMGMVLFLSLAVELVLSLAVPIADPAAGPTRAQISAPVELVETGHDLDCEIARNGGEGDGDAFVRRSRRCAVEREGEALQADGSAIDRLRHRQRPIRGRSFGEQGDASSGRRRDVDDDAASTSAVLAPDRFDGERRAFAQQSLFRHPRLRRGEGSVLRRRAAGQHEIGLSFGRHAQRLAHRIVKLETQLHRSRAILRHDRKRQDDVAGISNRDQVVFRDGLRRGPQHVDGLDVLRSRKVEARRHAGVAGIAPIGVPAALESDLDAGADGFARHRRAGDETHGEASSAMLALAAAMRLNAQMPIAPGAAVRRSRIKPLMLMDRSRDETLRAPVNSL